jgi:hypothetical protein
MEKTKKRTTVTPVQPAPAQAPLPELAPQPQPAPPVDEALNLLDALEMALPKSEFWTPQLCAAHKSAVEFLKTKGLRQ